MSQELIYFLKINLAIVLFYGFYRLFFYKDTFFMWRRITLLAIVIVALLYPMLNIQDWIKGQTSMVAVAELYSAISLPDVNATTPGEAAPAAWEGVVSTALLAIYWITLAALLIHFFIQLFGIIRLGLGTRTAYVSGIKVHILTQKQGPFSFFKWIFIHPTVHNDEETEEILTHELTHVCQWHSLDVVLSELMCAFCWFNPFAWLLKREIRNNLEYLADHNVLEEGYDYKTYQYHLLGLAYQKPASRLSNNFNILPLKNRIKMMNKKRSRKIERAKYLLFVPLIAFLLITSNIEAISRTANKILESNTLTEIKPAPEEVPEEDTTIFEVVEQMPEYPGGQKALMNHLSMNIKYPIAAQQAGIEGRVIVQFTVNANGNITNPVVVKSVSPELDREALRVISSLGKWTPGKQRGKPVNVKYTVPVMFRLQYN